MTTDVVNNINNINIGDISFEFNCAYTVSVSSLYAKLTEQILEEFCVMSFSI